MQKTEYNSSTIISRIQCWFLDLCCLVGRPVPGFVKGLQGASGLVELAVGGAFEVVGLMLGRVSSVLQLALWMVWWLVSPAKFC